MVRSGDMKQITLQYATTGSFVSHAVRFMTWSEWSHVDYVLPDGRLLGAQGDGVKIRPPDYEKFTSRCIQTFECTEEQYVIFTDFLYSQLGKPYDWTAIVGFVMRREWAADDSWFCSELIAAAIMLAKILKINVDRNRVSPEPLREIVGTIAISEVCT
jgi:uncharacterized protein YycO